MDKWLAYPPTSSLLTVGAVASTKQHCILWVTIVALKDNKGTMSASIIGPRTDDCFTLVCLEDPANRACAILTMTHDGGKTFSTRIAVDKFNMSVNYNWVNEVQVEPQEEADAHQLPLEELLPSEEKVEQCAETEKLLPMELDAQANRAKKQNKGQKQRQLRDLSPQTNQKQTNRERSPRPANTNKEGTPFPSAKQTQQPTPHHHPSASRRAISLTKSHSGLHQLNNTTPQPTHNQTPHMQKHKQTSPTRATTPMNHSKFSDFRFILTGGPL